MDFEIDCSCRPGLDAPAVTVNDRSESSRPLCDRKARLRVFEYERFGSVLPSGDFVPQPSAQRLGIERSAIEKDGADIWTIAQEIRKVTCDGAVGCIRERPLT